MMLIAANYQAQIADSRARMLRMRDYL